MSIKNMNNYKLVREEQIVEMNGVGYLLEHVNTKAKVFVISNDDNNKVFNIGFRTPPTDDTGVPHILEHSVLCGSKNFPAKDPFIELAKGSLNTFLNAMTYPDKTVYPIASCNDQDFRNLMHVYLDAVFYPNIYEREEILKQEGWHYELENEDGELTYNGVVYNEMKGAFSSPEQQLMRTIQKSLLKDTPYGYESGGDPEYITDLTYEDFLDFHKRYYHPSNSYIYLYGDMNVEEELTFIHDNYLSNFDYLEIDSSINMQEAPESPMEFEEYYSLSDAEDLENNTYLSYNSIVGTSLDRETYLAFQIIDYVLIDVPGAPIKEALVKANIGDDIFSSYENSILQPIYSIVSKGANNEDKDRFVNVIRETLSKLVEEGINKRSIEASINHFEFKYKEANYGRYPKGLMYGLQAFDSWLYDSSEPYMHIVANETFEFLKKQIDTDYFEQLIKKYLLDNNHRSVVVVKPEKGLNARLEQQDREKLAAHKNDLSKDEVAAIIQSDIDLKEYQSIPSTKEELEKIPLLKLEDIGKKARTLNNHIGDISGVTTVSHNIFTNGIGYMKLSFDIKDMPWELVPYLSLATAVFRYVDTEKFSYNDLSNEINIETGGIGFITQVLNASSDKDGYIPTFEINTKALYEKMPIALTLIEEILFTSKLDDYDRLKEIIAEIKSQLKMGITSSGHTSAANRALSYFSKSAYFKEVTEGISSYEFIDDICKNFEARKEGLVAGMKESLAEALRKGNLTISYTGDNNIVEYSDSINHFIKKLSTRPEHDTVQEVVLEEKNEGFKTASKVQYVATAGNYMKAGYNYTGAINVMQVIFSYDYLWQQVRVKGGAYGSMCSFSRFGDSYFTSYRDPNLMETYTVYQGAPAYLENFEADDRDMLKYIIGAVSKLDMPLNPSDEGNYSWVAYKLGLTEEDLQRERDELLATNVESIRALAPLVESIIGTGIICAIGDEVKLDNNKDNFKKVVSIF